jgi:peptidoglycan/LPS O-acetylase OafA/YrhL
LTSRQPGLDLLRAAAIGWVMLYHLASYGVSFPAVVRYGWMGVDLFFVLSGYLIGWQLLKPYTCGQPPRWGQWWAHFMLRRALRVLPAYCTVLAVYFAVPGTRESEAIAPLWQFLTFTTNLFPDYFHHHAFSHAWSLCVEEHFYVVLPAAVWLLARRPSSGAVVLAAVTVLVAGMVLRGWLWQHEVVPYLQVRSGERNVILRYVEVIYNPTYTRLDGLLAGVMLAAVKGFRPRWWSRLMEWGWVLLAAGVAGIGVAMWIEPVSGVGAIVVFPLLSASLACVLLAAVSPRTWIGRYRVPGARRLAALSFSLYLTHKQVYHWVQDSFGAVLEQSDLLAFAAYNGAALAVAALLYVCVERPALRLRERLSAAAAGSAPAVAAQAGH